MTDFAWLGVPAELVVELASLGVDEPFAVQAMVIPDALAGLDLTAKAPTGSGKTLAFGLPVVAMVGQAAPGRPRALILAPTRELAQQISDVLHPLAATYERRVHAFFGGTDYRRQAKALRNGVDVAVGCPGRLEDLIEHGDLSLAEVDIVVVDEADRMADMGFLPSVRRLLDQVNPARQTMLFSATLDGDVDELVRHYQHDPVIHELAVEESQSGEMRHVFLRTLGPARVKTAAKIARSHRSTVLFCRTRHGTERLARQLRGEGVDAVAIHGDRSQREREQALSRFQSGAVRALVATDVAARGIHVDDVECVIHFDPPADAKDYTHRSGRTARAGRDGVVVSLVVPEKDHAVRKLQRELGLQQEYGELVDALPSGPVSATAPVIVGTVGTVPVRAAWLAP